MATIEYTPENEENANTYQVQKPVIFSRNDKGSLQADLQSPIAKRESKKEFTIRNPFKKEENEEGKKEITVRSPVEKKEEENKTRVVFRR